MYRFNKNGKHLKTFNANTGVVIYTFGYDANGRLESITDADTNVITVNRNGNGVPVSIEAPFGQITTVATNGKGYITGLTNLENETYAFDYYADNLLKSMTNPRSKTYSFAYDSNGRLERDNDPAGGFQQLSRQELADGYQVTKTTASGRTNQYTIERPSSTELRRSRTYPDGTQSETVVLNGYDTTIDLPDGTQVHNVRHPDPRFEMKAPIMGETTVSMPSGLANTTNITRSVTPAGEKDFQNIQTITTQANINGRFLYHGIQ